MSTASRILILAVSLLACSKPGSGPSTTRAPLTVEAPTPDAAVETKPEVEQAPVPDIDLDSKDVLARTTTQPVAYVKHVLFGWAALADNYHGRIDPRAANRSNADAAKLAKEIYQKLAAAPDTIDELVKTYSEDPGSLSGTPYKVTEQTAFVPEFKQLALRLEDKEVAIVKTVYGYHVMVRVAKPAPDPIESTDILGRTKTFELVDVRHILVGWKESPAAKDPRAKERSKEDAAKLAKDLLRKVKAGGDMVKLMSEYSEDPGSKDSGLTYSVSEDEALVEGFKELAMRLQVGEVGIVKTEFGYHVMKRVAPDSLQSNAILARPVVQQQGARIKYILLGWKDAHIDDPRGTERDRPALEKLTKATLARLAKKDTVFEDVMKELSEDKQTGETGLAIRADIPGLPAVMKMLAQRLKVGELGVVTTRFGLFIIKRVEDSAPPTP